jgi:fucose permease
MAGAMMGGFIAAQHVSLKWHFFAVSLVYLAFSIPCARALLESPKPAACPAARHLPSVANMPEVIWALSAIGLCILLSEGAIGDWAAVYLRQIFHVGPAIAANGYAVFCAAMAACRFVGDHVNMLLGSVRTVRFGSLIAASGLAVVIAAPSALWAMPGFMAIGTGLSVIVPLVFGAAGRVPNVRPGDGISTVTGVGYLGFLVGPPSLGFISQLVTLRGSFVALLILCLIASSLSGFLAEAQPTQGAWDEPSPVV